MTIPLTARFLSLVVHDLRNPLNAIDLSLQVIDQEVPEGHAELEEDLKMVRENVAQIERMLKHLADYSRLLDEPVRLTPMLFDPRRLISDMVEEFSTRTKGGPPASIRLEVLPGCPAEVELDQFRAQTAIQHLLANAIGTAENSPIRIILDGTPGRLAIEAAVERPPHPSVEPAPLRPDDFERLLGTPASRVGLELSIVARISELFGGNARLGVTKGRGTSVYLEWPARMPSPVEA